MSQTENREGLIGCLPILLETLYLFVSFMGSIGICYVVFLDPDMGLAQKLFVPTLSLIYTSENTAVVILSGAMLLIMMFLALAFVFVLGYLSWFFMAYPAVILSKALAFRIVMAANRLSTWFMASTLLLPPAYFLLGIMGIGGSDERFVLALVMMFGSGVATLLVGIIRKSPGMTLLMKSVWQTWLGFIMRTRKRATLSTLLGLLFLLYLYWLCWSSGMFRNIPGAIVWHLSLFYTFTITAVWSNILARVRTPENPREDILEHPTEGDRG